MTNGLLQSYPEPVAALAPLGQPDTFRERANWPDYAALGLTTNHVEDLLCLAEDPAVNSLPADAAAVWAPVHACRALAQLGAVEAAPRLVRLLQTYQDDDYLNEEMPHVMAAIGPGAIPAIAAFAGEARMDRFPRIIAGECLEQIGQDHPNARPQCVAVIVERLAQHASNHRSINGFLIANLIGLRATEAIGTIRAAFAAGQVDLTVTGDLEDVEIELGFRLFRETPPPKINLFAEADDDERAAGDHCANGLIDENLLDDNTGQAFNPFRDVGRNDLCPCGSGKKFKKCCLNELR